MKLALCEASRMHSHASENKFLIKSGGWRQAWDEQDCRQSQNMLLNNPEEEGKLILFMGVFSPMLQGLIFER